MYRVVRQLHTIAGLTVLAFVVMYVLTGYVMTHRGWFGEPEPTSTVRSERLATGKDGTEPGTPEEWAIYLRDAYQLEGRIDSARRLRNGKLQVVVAKPGLRSVVEVSRDRQTAQITEERMPWQQTAIAFHRLHGYGHERLYDLWAVALDLASIALIVFGLTGVYLWYKLKRRRLLGWILLALSYGVTFGTLLILMYGS